MTRRNPFRRVARLLTPLGWNAVLLAAVAVVMTITLGARP